MSTMRPGVVVVNVMRAVLLAMASMSWCGGRAQEVVLPDPLLAARVHALAAAGNDSLKVLASDLLKRDLLSALGSEGAFTRDFNDIPLSRVDAPDGKFRLFTWNIPLADGSHRYEGLLLVHDKRTNTVVELHDETNALDAPERIELTPARWYGALYYAVVPVKRGGKTLYTLLGWKGYSKVETRKVVEVLSFKGTAARFGAEVFETHDAKGRPERIRKSRLIFGFNFQASMSLKWDAVNARLICDHLSPSRQDMEGQWPFYGPDMSYDAYVWEKNHWAYQRDIDARDAERNGKPWNRPPRE